MGLDTWAHLCRSVLYECSRKSGWNVAKGGKTTTIIVRCLRLYLQVVLQPIGTKKDLNNHIIMLFSPFPSFRCFQVHSVLLL